MKKLILFTLLLIPTLTYSAEEDVWLAAHFASFHIGSDVWYDDQGQEHQWNQFNPGIGINYEALENIELGAGAYLNSHEEPSLYIKWNFHSSFQRTLAHGVNVGLVSGYDVAQTIDTPVTGFVLPYISIQPVDKVRIELGYMPSIGETTGESTSVVTLTMYMRLNR